MAAKVVTMLPKFALLIAGSRTYDNYNEFVSICNKSLSQKKKDHDIIIVSGGAKGTDTMARIFAISMGYEFKEFPADWKKYGKTAGYIRNVEMHKFLLDYEERGCLCFWNGESKGTAHNFKLCEQYGTQLAIYNYINSEINIFKYKKG